MVVTVCVIFHRKQSLLIICIFSVFPGLDYNRDFSPRDVQQEVFEKQIQIACDLKRRGTIRPLFLHERDAHEDFVRILSKYRDQLPNVVVHCFSGTQEECKVYLEMGFYIGFTGKYQN